MELRSFSARLFDLYQPVGSSADLRCPRFRACSNSTYGNHKPRKSTFRKRSGGNYTSESKHNDSCRASCVGILRRKCSLYGQLKRISERGWILGMYASDTTCFANRRSINWVNSGTYSSKLAIRSKCICSINCTGISF